MPCRADLKSDRFSKYGSSPIRFLLFAVPVAQVIHIGAMYTPGLSDVLGLSPISTRQWLTLLSVAGILLVVEEIHKYFLRKKWRG